MRFEFCGNLDCPEWVLSEIGSIYYSIIYIYIYFSYSQQDISD